MAIGFTNATDVDGRWQFFGETLHTSALEEYYPNLVLHDLGQHILLPGHRGKKIYVTQWNKVNPVGEIGAGQAVVPTHEPNSAAYPEDESPASHAMDIINYEGTLQGFGGSFKYTDIHASINEMMDELTAGARQLGGGYAYATEKNALKILLDAADSSDANQQAFELGASGTAWGATTTTSNLTVTDLSRVVATFEGNDVDGITYRYPTGNYRAIVHPYAKHDLLTFVGASQPNLVNWLQTTRGQGMFEAGQIPVIMGVEIETSAFDTLNPFSSFAKFNGSSWPTEMDTPGFAAGNTGYISWFFGPGAFANLDLANGTPSLIIQPFGSGGATGDSLKRVMTVGIKGYQTCIPLDMARRCIMMATGSSL